MLDNPLAIIVVALAVAVFGAMRLLVEARHRGSRRVRRYELLLIALVFVFTTAAALAVADALSRP